MTRMIGNIFPEYGAVALNHVRVLYVMRDFPSYVHMSVTVIAYN